MGTLARPVVLSFLSRRNAESQPQDGQGCPSSERRRPQPDHRPTRLPVLEGDASDTFTARVFEAECDAYPEASRMFAEGRLVIEKGQLRIGCALMSLRRNLVTVSKLTEHLGTTTSSQCSPGG